MATEFEIIDVTPRDGLQNEPVIFSIEEKLQLISRSIETGISRIEVASFVNPKKVPTSIIFLGDTIWTNASKTI